MSLVVVGTGQFLEGNVLTPKLVGESVGLHPVWLMFALLAFGSLFGFTGLASFIAALFKLYRIEPAPGAGWKEPVPSFAPGVALPVQDVRVRISLREYDAEGKEIEPESDSEGEE